MIHIQRVGGRQPTCLIIDVPLLSLAWEVSTLGDKPIHVQCSLGFLLHSTNI